MKRYLSLLPALLVFSTAFAQDPVVQAIVNGTSVDSMITDLQQLDGETTIDVGAGPQTITSRHKLNPGNALAAEWLQQRATELGYTPVVQGFSMGTGENILVEKTGALHPGRKVILCAHYDAMPAPPSAAPAADDDGSGTVAVLEAMRLFAPHQFENTIVFALWDEEEQGKVGSAFYAGQAAANDDTLIAVINMDAISYDGDGDDLMRIHTKNVSTSVALKDTAVMANALYGINIPYAINNPGATYSDHASFWTEGYPAILIIEDFDNDGNPHYHTTTDLTTYLDLPYFQKLAQLSFATTAIMAQPITSGTGIAVVTDATPRLRAWPVPAGQRLNIAFEGAAVVDHYRLIDATGRTVKEVPARTGTIAIDLADLPNGNYRILAIREQSVIASAAMLRIAR